MPEAAAEPSVVNVAAYRFASLTGLRELRKQLQDRCRLLELRGTILLSPEGINLFVAGGATAIESLLTDLRAIAGLSGLSAKYSRTATQPFRRMLVRIKKEIIAFGVPGIDPARHTSPRITPRELKRWIDEGRSFTLLDTRNDYEIRLGTFRGAVPIGVDHFRDFPQAVEHLPATLRAQPVVTFCTGGIRCEKAAPFLESRGFGEVWQLDGGILKYFEECGGAHFDGECFVFDQRVGLDAGLNETASTQCFACQSPLTAAEQQDERYVAGRSCPHCHRTDAERQQEQFAARQAALLALVDPLPGSRPRDNYRPLSVPHRADGSTLRDALAQVVRHLPAGYWDAQCQAGYVTDARREPVAADRVVRAGERYLHRSQQEVEPDVRADIRLLYEDPAIVVLDKPAPLPVHPGGRYNRNTLQYLLEALYHPQKPRPAHRLDANTTGVMVVARTRHFAGRLQPQFEAGAVRKCYLALVHGHPADDAFTCDAPISTSPGVLGTREIDEQGGLPAVTRFRVLERRADGTTLLQIHPETGRTNQIRLHCAHLGLAIVGDQAYGGATGAMRQQTHALEDAPLCLHAWQLCLRHPASGDAICFAAPAPSWAGDLAGRVPQMRGPMPADCQGA